jgi:hypothetical protein
MITERETSQITGRFLAKRLNRAIPLLIAAAAALTILSIGLVRAGVQSGTLANNSQPTADPDWSELIASMDKMHMAMGAVARSGNSDVDFVRLMLPHQSGRNRHGENPTIVRQGSTNAQASAGNHHRPAIRNCVDAALAETTTPELI